ncbi:MAG: magnesium transporter [Gammaproteobacteria bacterium]|nr:magnesium transporter [Gammaproteobacteria bacterium]MCF6259770.1 magnesium transporter [Gammaproteobacteria bacterium]
MPNSNKEHEHRIKRLQAFTDLLRDSTLARVERELRELHPAEIAHLLEALPHEQRDAVWELVSAEQEGDVLLQVNDDVRERLIRDMDNSELLAAAEGLETDDLADILSDFPDGVTDQVLEAMDAQHRERLEAVMSYPEDTAGGLMNTDTITVRADISLDVVLRYLRRIGEIPEMTDQLIVTNRENKYLGLLPLAALLIKNPDTLVAEHMDREREAILATLPEQEVASLFEKRDLVSAPVVDEEGRLLGRITIDDVVDVIRDEAEHSLMSMAGLSEEDDMFAPVATSSKRRAVWLGVNLLTALLASWVIGQFDATLEKMVALAILMPIVASMGGIAGNQTLTLVIRGMALGQISRSNARRLFNKELLVGGLNGVIWALIVGGIVTAWFGDAQLGGIIAAAMLINLIVAAMAGATIPLMLKRVGIDPALAGGVLLTTVTDVIGFLAFLGLAALLLY